LNFLQSNFMKFGSVVH